MRQALIAAASLEVVCRDCGECQPNPAGPDESTIWTIEEVAKASEAKTIITCVACDEKMQIIAQSKAQVVPLEVTVPDGE